MAARTFQPRFSLSDVTRAQLVGIEHDASLLAAMSLLPRHEQWLRREVTHERAGATTRIEGIGEREPADATERRQVENANANAVRAYEFIDYLSDLLDQQLDELAIRQINREFLHGVSPALTPGVYRKGPNHVGDYTPPDQGDVPELMRAFARWMDGRTEHPVVSAGIAHIHLVAVHPFWDGNGRTARGLEALLLQRSNFHFRKLLSMENRLLALRPQYFAAIERTLGTTFSSYDATPWLDFYVPMLAQEVRDVVAQVTDWQRRSGEIRVLAAQSQLHQRQVDALLFLTKAGRIARSDYIELTGVSPMTASRDLKALIEKGFVVAQGRTATTTYRLAERLQNRPP